MNSNVRKLETYIKDIKFASDKYKDIITVEHRSDNPKRDYLFVNKLQAKHIPCDPVKMIGMCEDLAEIVNEKLNDRYHNILVVGFAETATAIAHFVAENVHLAKYVMCTTREDIDETIGKQLITFEEEHSHATTQKLYTWINCDFNFKSVDYILFVEDEISTGNTILNFIKAFKQQDVIRHDVNFGVASICNWQDNENKKLFSDNNIDTFCLIRGELQDVNAKMSVESVVDDCKTEFSMQGQQYLVLPKEIFYKLRLGHRLNDRITVQNIVPTLNRDVQQVEIIGTEECMATSILLGYKLTGEGYKVYCHSTTRSCIDVLEDDNNNTEHIAKRYNVQSVYDSNRKTYIYNLMDNAQKIILSDTPI